jgi:agmatinase
MDKSLPIGQGHGVPGRYAGLPDQYCNLFSSDIVILPVPFDQTSTYQKGSNQGPAALIEASRNMELYDIETNSEVYTKGIFTAGPVEEKTSESMLESTYQKVKELLHLNKFVIVIGGEHSISYAPIRAHAEYAGPITVLQLDAHADLQSLYENNPWSHACVMARVREIPQVTKIVSAGIRSMSADELINLDRTNTFFAHELDENWLWMDQLLEKLKGPVYVTIDLDVFDSSIMPSTGTPEPGGLNWDQMMALFRKIVKSTNIIGFDVVELCPRACNPAPDYLAAKLIYKLLSYKFFTDKL